MMCHINFFFKLGSNYQRSNGSNSDFDARSLRSNMSDMSAFDILPDCIAPEPETRKPATFTIPPMQAMPPDGHNVQTFVCKITRQSIEEGCMELLPVEGC